MISILRALPPCAPAALIGLLLIGCGNVENSEESTATTPQPSPVALTQVCFNPAALQVNGGKLLHAMNVTEEGGNPRGPGTRITPARLRGVAHGAFALSLQASLRSIRRAGSRANDVVDAARDGLAEVRRDPSILLDEPRLAVAFAQAQALAERDGFVPPGCDR